MRLAQKAREIRDASDQVKRYSEQTIRYTFVADSWLIRGNATHNPNQASSMPHLCLAIVTFAHACA